MAEEFWIMISERLQAPTLPADVKNLTFKKKKLSTRIGLKLTLPSKKAVKRAVACETITRNTPNKKVRKGEVFSIASTKTVEMAALSTDQVAETLQDNLCKASIFGAELHTQLTLIPEETKTVEAEEKLKAEQAARSAAEEQLKDEREALSACEARLVTERKDAVAEYKAGRDFLVDVLEFARAHHDRIIEAVLTCPKEAIHFFCRLHENEIGRLMLLKMGAYGFLKGRKSERSELYEVMKDFLHDNFDPADYDLPEPFVVEPVNPFLSLSGKQ